MEAIKPDEHLNDIFRFNKLTKLLDKVANLTGVLVNGTFSFAIDGLMFL